jgi:hypothetical protein
MTIRPRYERIEFCRSAETLWGKLEEGRWDWLGVHPKGQFVLGSPPANRTQVFPVGIVTSSPVAPRNRTGITIQEPTAPASERWYSHEDEAQAEFDRQLAEARAEGRVPRVVRLRLLVDGVVRQEEFVVHRPSTYR